MSKALENMSFKELLDANKKMDPEKEDLESKLSSTKSKLTSAELKLSEAQFQLDQMKRKLYDSKKERFIKNTDENQMELPFDVQ
jgi:chromosome segregation ATPase